MASEDTRERAARLEVFLHEVYDESRPGTQGARDAVLELLAVVSPPQPQRQDSLDAQFRTMYDLACHAGCYDAADWLNQHFTAVAPVSPSPVDAGGCARCGDSQRVTDPELVGKVDPGADWMPCPVCVPLENAEVEAAIEAIPAERVADELLRHQIAGRAVKAAREVRISLAAAPPVGADEAKLRVRAMLKLKANRKGYVDIADRTAWSNGWEACLRAGEYLSLPSSAAPGVTEAEAIEKAAEADYALVAKKPITWVNNERRGTRTAHDKAWAELDDESRLVHRRKARAVAAALAVSPAPTEGPNCPECSTPLLPIREGASERKLLCVRCRRAFAPTEGPDDA